MSSKVGSYDHLEKVELPLDMDDLARRLVIANFGVHRFLSALIRARVGHYETEDRLMDGIRRLLDKGEH